MTNDTPLLYEIRESACYLTLNRPDKRNALNAELIEALKDGLARAGQDAQVKVIVLRAAGADFCAGMDLAQLQRIAQLSLLENRADAGQLAALYGQFRTTPKPIIAAVHGRALAGGAGLAASCDLVLATGSAQFCFTETRIGFVPAMVAAIARRNLTEKQAFEVLTLAKPFTAEQALAYGFINRVCDDNELDSALTEFVNEVTRVSASAVQLTKSLLYQTDAMNFDQAIQIGIETNAIARMTPDCQAGVQKFLNK